jgi:hypothetical protein
MTDTAGANDGISIAAGDIFRAADEGIVSHSDAERLVNWARQQSTNITPSKLNAQASSIETEKGLNLATVAYYFGAMLMISACAWFLGDKWNVLGSRGVLIVALIYLVVALFTGLLVRAKGFPVGGGLLVTVAVCLVPLITYSIESLTGFWPAGSPGDYKNYYPLIHGSWIVMELATIAAAALALRYVRFGFLTAPMAFSLWFMSMDLAALIRGESYLDNNGRQEVSIAVGLLSIVVGYSLDRLLHSREAPKSEDFAFWCYLFGLMAFWGGMTFLDSGSELKRFIYLLINIGLIAIAIKLRRATFLIFGALGVHIYLGHLAYEIFRDSFLFPFALALLGLSLILVTVFAQRLLLRRASAEPAS